MKRFYLLFLTIMVTTCLCAAWRMAQNHNDILLPIYTRVGAHDYLYVHKDDVEIISPRSWPFKPSSIRCRRINTLLHPTPYYTIPHHSTPSKYKKNRNKSKLFTIFLVFVRIFLYLCGLNGKLYD